MALPSNDKIPGDLGHTSDHNAIIDEITGIKSDYLLVSSSSNYLPTSSSANFLPVSASSNYLPVSASSNFLPTTSSANYLQISNASATYAKLVSPTFTGTPLAPTAVGGTNTTQIATTAFVTSAVLAAQSGSVDLSSYLTVANASATYLNISSSANYLPMGASANYLPVSASSDYLPISASSNFATVNISTNAQTGTSYTLALTDSGKIIEMNNAAANLIIVPLNSSVPFPIGTKIDFVQTGAGATSASVVSGVTLDSDTNKRTINAQWAAASLIKRSTDTWLLIGALKA